MADTPTRTLAARIPFPVDWLVAREATNPVITNTVAEPSEQYSPGCCQVANGDVWVYVKGGAHIYGYKSTDGGVTFAIQNSGNPVISPGAGAAWDSKFTLEAVTVYDLASDTIHLWYKGTNDATGATAWAWGHATAPGSTPTVFTKDAANPILTGSTVSTALGGSAVGDLGIGDVIGLGTGFQFYGYCQYGGIYTLIQATGSTWNNPSSVTSILPAPGGWQDVILRPNVARLPNGLYAMLYTVGGDQGTIEQPRKIRPAASIDGINWLFTGSDVIGPYGPPSPGWEVIEVFAASILKSSSPPYAAPALDTNGRWHLYYSGLEAGTKHAQVGLAYLTPTVDALAGKGVFTIQITSPVGNSIGPFAH